MKYRKKPIFVEAFQFGKEKAPSWFLNHVGNYDSQYNFIQIPIKNGYVSAEYGDMIVKDEKDEIYPCKENIFYETYESCEKDR